MSRYFTDPATGRKFIGDQYIPGVFGPNGASRNVGKWCRQGSSPFDMLASKASGDLITVGADGRGGRIKILRSHNPLMVGERRLLYEMLLTLTPIMSLLIGTC